MEKSKKALLRNSISNFDITSVIDDLMEYFELEADLDYSNSKDKEVLLNSFLIISGNYRRILNERTIGIIPDSDYSIGINRISYSLLGIVDTLPTSTDEHSISFEKITDFSYRLSKSKRINSLRRNRLFSFDFFVCHSEKNSSTAEFIYDSLTSIGLRVFKSNFLSSVNYGLSIKDNLNFILKDSFSMIIIDCESPSGEFIAEYTQVVNDYNDRKRSQGIYMYRHLEMPNLDIKVEHKEVKILSDIIDQHIEKISKLDSEIKVDSRNEFEVQKSKFYHELVDAHGEDKIVQCPSCSYPIRKRDLSDSKMFLGFIISCVAGYFFLSAKVSWYLLFFLIPVLGFLGMIAMVLLISMVEVLLNRSIIYNKCLCYNCHYKVMPRDKEVKHTDQMVALDVDNYYANIFVSAQTDSSHIRKHINKNKIIRALDGLKIMLLREKDIMSLNKVEDIENRYLENIKNRNTSMIDTNEFVRVESAIIKDIFAVLNKYVEYTRTMSEKSRSNKNFNQDALKLKEALSNVNCQKYLRLFLENNVSHADLWTLDENILSQLGMTNPVDINNVLSQILLEKSNKIENGFIFVAILAALGTTSLLIPYFPYLNITPLEGISGYEIIDNGIGIFENQSIVNSVFIVTPYFDILAGIASLSIVPIIILVLVFYKKITSSHTYSMALLLATWVIMAPMFFYSLHCVAMIISVVPFCINEYSTQDSDTNLINFLFSLFGLGLVLRSILFITMYNFLPKVYNRFMKNPLG